VLLERAAHRRGVLGHLAQTADPHRHAAGCGHPDESFPQWDLGAHTLSVVTVARDRVQPGAVLVEQEQQRVLVAQQLGQPRERDADEGVEVLAAIESRRELGEMQRARGGVDRRHAVRRFDAIGPFEVLAVRGREHVLDRHHAVDVGRAQLEHVLHSCECRNRVDVGVEPLEHRAPAFGPLVHQAQPVLVVVQRVEREQAQARVLGDIARCLRQELIGERDPLVVDEMNLRDVRDVGRAVGRRRGNHGRHHSFEAHRDVPQPDLRSLRGLRRLARHHDDATSMAVPAPGPGLWS
jgi:hypothetical protein